MVTAHTTFVLVALWQGAQEGNPSPQEAFLLSPKGEQGLETPRHPASHPSELSVHLQELCYSLVKQRWVDKCVASQGIQSRQPLNG